MRKNFNAKKYNEKMDKLWEKCKESKLNYQKELEDKLNVLYWEKTKIESAIAHIKNELKMREEN